MSEHDEKLHYISVTGIIHKDGRYLICKRSPHEKAFPNKWCVPGGKIEKSDFIDSPKDTSDHWLGVFEKVLEKEIFEETSLTIKNIGYVTSAAFIRPTGHTSLIVSLYADHKSGEVSLNEDELVDYAWVNLEEAKNYDLIEGIYGQIEKVDSLLKVKN